MLLWSTVIFATMVIMVTTIICVLGCHDYADVPEVFRLADISYLVFSNTSIRILLVRYAGGVGPNKQLCGRANGEE
jgi:hypothetical protein